MPTVRIVTATTVPASGICSDQTMVAKAKLASPRGPNHAKKALFAIGSPVPVRENDWHHPDYRQTKDCVEVTVMSPAGVTVRVKTAQISL